MGKGNLAGKVMEVFSWIAVAFALTFIISVSFLLSGCRNVEAYFVCAGSLASLLGLYIIIHYYGDGGGMPSDDSR